MCFNFYMCFNTRKVSNKITICYKSYNMVRFLDKIPEDKKKEIRTAFKTTLKSEQQDVKAIKEWLKQQPHLPQSDDLQIESILRINKYCIEVTKKKIDMYYTMRTRFPKIYKHINPKQPEMMAYADDNYFLPLPTLTRNNVRVSIVKPTSNADFFDPVRNFALTLAVYELRLIEDFNFGNIFIVDGSKFGISHLTKMNLMFLKQVNLIIEEAYTSRVAEIHFINTPAIFDRFLVIFKSIINAKIAKRIHVHDKIEGLYEFTPREILPGDYGGNAKSMKELQEDLKASLRSLQPHFDHLDTLKVNENLRLEPLNDEFFGIQGNFKKLDVD